MSDILTGFLDGSSVEFRTSCFPPVTVPLSSNGKSNFVLDAVKGFLNPEIALVNGGADVYTFDMTGNPPSQNWPMYFGLVVLIVSAILLLVLA